MWWPITRKSINSRVPGSVLINIIGVSSSFNVCNLGPLSWFFSCYRPPHLCSVGMQLYLMLFWRVAPDQPCPIIFYVPPQDSKINTNCLKFPNCISRINEFPLLPRMFPLPAESLTLHPTPSMWGTPSHSSPDQGWNLCSLQWKCSLNHWTTKEVPPSLVIF